MNKNKALIKELNSLLKGVHMGEDTFKTYRDKAMDESLKTEMEEMLSIFDNQKRALIAYVKKLDGEAKDSLGIGGEISSTFEKLKDMFMDSDKDILNHAIKSLDMGIKGMEKVIDSCKKIDAEKYIVEDLEAMLDDYKDTAGRLHILSKETI